MPAGKLTSFHRRSGNVIAQVGEFERTLLQRLMASVIELLAPTEAPGEDPFAALVGWKESAERPSDPALARLLPNGVEGDGPEVEEFRRLSEMSIRQAKISALQAAAVALEREYLTLSIPQAELFAQALNDVRLVLAERLGIRNAADADQAHARFRQCLSEPEYSPESEPEKLDDELLRLYYFASVLHNALVSALLGHDTAPDAEVLGGESDEPQ